MNWANNLVSIVEEEHAGTCPYCKSKNMDYTLKIVDKKNMMGYGAIWCNDCKKAFHISRIKVSKEKIKDFPRDVVF